MSYALYDDYVSMKTTNWWVQREARRGIDGLTWAWPLAGSYDTDSLRNSARHDRPAAGGRQRRSTGLPNSAAVTRPA